MNKELRELIGLLVSEGFVVRATKRNHYTVRTATGAYVTTLASTPSDHRGRKNANAAIKRARKEQAGQE